MLVALSGVHSATAQTVTYLRIVSGDGQVACLCLSATLQQFQPITVQALDANQHPVANATINWTVTGGQAVVKNPDTTTDANGMSTNPLSQTVTIVLGTLTQPYLASTIQASANNGNPSVTFYETFSLIDFFGQPMVSANIVLYNGAPLDQATLTGNSGTVLSSSIQVFVGGQGLAGSGVQHVSVSLLPSQASPGISCAVSGQAGDPGAVLTGGNFNTNPLLNAACTPVLSGSGTGQFYILIGGVPTSDDLHDNQPLSLQRFGPYTFTAIPGAPAAVQLIQGDGQTLSPGTSLGTLIARVVDSRGNGVQNVTVQWTLNPANAVVFFGLAQTLTDGNGNVSAAAAFSGPAAGVVGIKVSVVSNPSISATFNETAIVQISSLQKVSGDLQTAPAGSAFSSPVVVQVNNGFATVANYPVQFSISGPATLSAGTVNTNNQGQAQVIVTASSGTGPVTVTVSVGGFTKTFALTVIPAGPIPNGVTEVSGDLQNAIVNTNFPAPLIVQVNSTSGPVGNYTVTFSSSGPVTLSASSAITGSNGQAQIGAQAGATTGPATVIAAIAGHSVTFNLTVNPPGPTLTAASFLNGASLQPGFISPCSIATIIAAGLAPNGASSLYPGAIFGALPTHVNGLSVSFNNYPAPIFNVAMVGGQPQVTVQVPCEVTPSASVPVTVNVGAGSSSVNIPVLTVSPGILQTTYSDGVVRAVVLRSDGSFATLSNPARKGEIVRVYATGLGGMLPIVGTNQVDNPDADLHGADAQATGQIVVGISGGGSTVITTRVAPNLIGVFEIAFIVPSNATTGNDVAISVGVVPAGSSTKIDSLNSKIPIQ